MNTLWPSTVKELNASKIYRLIKVLWVATASLIFIACIGIFADEFDTDNAEINKDKTLIRCYLPRDPQTYKASDVDFEIPLEYFKRYDFQDEDHRALIQDVAEKVYALCGISKQERDAHFQEQLAKTRTSGTPQYESLIDVEEHITYSRNWAKTALWSAISLLVILTISEIIRRCVYYVLLGSLRPKKQ